MSRSVCNGTLAVLISTAAACSHRVAVPPSEPAGPTGQLVGEINRMRSDPPGYARHIEERLPFYRGKVLRLPGQVPLLTFEGAGAAREAIRALQATEPLPALAESAALAAAARDHAQDIGPKGRMSHEGSRGETLEQRIDRYAESWNYVAENISFGPDRPRAVILELLIDDNVPGRGHRRILLDPKLRHAGAFCGPHAAYRTVCVIDFAGEISERGTTPRPAAATRR